MASRQSNRLSENADEPARPLLLGHRGTTIYAPENTFAAFDCALADGCDGIEFDVRVTSDSHAIICHDPSYAHREISETTLNSLLDCGVTCPLLSSVVERYAARCFLYIELKAPRAERELLSLLRDHPPVYGYVVASFHPEILVRIHDLDPEIPVGLICGSKRQLHRWPQFPIDYVLLKHSLATTAHVSALHGSGKKVFAWTVNKPKHMRKLAEIGVDGILSDDTRLLVGTLSPRPRPIHPDGIA